MLNKNTGIRLLLLASLASVIMVPVWLMAPENTIGKTKVERTSVAGIFDWLFKKRKERPISRDPVQRLCLINPNGKIYSTNPLFLWQGDLKAIALSKSGYKKKNFWQQEITNPKTLVIYQGEALQPGQSYDWKGFIDESPSIFITFQVMGEEERQKITDELKALEKKLQTQGADEKTVALEKANFFAEQELWSDALQQLYSVPNLAKELSSQTESLVDKLCQP